MSENDQSKNERLEKVLDFKRSSNPYPYSYEVNTTSDELHTRYEKLDIEEKSEQTVSLAGRVLLKRWMGSVIFMTLSDQRGKIQLYFNRNELKNYEEARKNIDLGDIIGVKGKVFRTQKGELTVRVDAFTILAKSLSGLADKYHGLKDIELKYRNRSLDMVMNSDVRDVLIKRFQITRAIREFMTAENFLEVETPITQIHYGGAAATPFITHHEKLDMDMYLRVSPEQNLKRIMAGGIEAVYEIGKSFRNENIDRTHNPEFTMLEAYRAYRDYTYCMDLLERLVEYICDQVLGTRKIKTGTHTIEFKRPWRRLSVAEALKKEGIDVTTLSDEQLIEKVEKLDKKFHQKSRGEAMLILFEEYCEDKIIEPTHIIGYPKESTPFAKLDRSNPELIERFESFILGQEIANAYSELNDPILQRELLENQTKIKKAGAEEVWGDIDEEFLEAMELGIPPAAGIGVGIDRLVCLLLDQPSIRDVIFFPTMKPRH